MFTKLALIGTASSLIINESRERPLMHESSPNRKLSFQNFISGEDAIYEHEQCQVPTEVGSVYPIMDDENNEEIGRAQYDTKIIGNRMTIGAVQLCISDRLADFEPSYEKLIGMTWTQVKAQPILEDGYDGSSNNTETSTFETSSPTANVSNPSSAPSSPPISSDQTTIDSSGNEQVSMPTPLLNSSFPSRSFESYPSSTPSLLSSFDDVASFTKAKSESSDDDKSSSAIIGAAIALAVVVAVAAFFAKKNMDGKIQADLEEINETAEQSDEMHEKVEGMLDEAHEIYQQGEEMHGNYEDMKEDVEKLKELKDKKSKSKKKKTQEEGKEKEEKEFEVEEEEDDEEVEDSESDEEEEEEDDESDEEEGRPPLVRQVSCRNLVPKTPQEQSKEAHGNTAQTRKDAEWIESAAEEMCEDAREMREHVKKIHEKVETFRSVVLEVKQEDRTPKHSGKLVLDTSTKKKSGESHQTNERREETHAGWSRTSEPARKEWQDEHRGTLVRKNSKAHRTIRKASPKVFNQQENHMVSGSLFDAACSFNETSQSADGVSVLSEENTHGLSYFLGMGFSDTRPSDDITQCSEGHDLV